MEKKDEVAFLKSVFGTKPIKKNNTTKKKALKKIHPRPQEKKEEIFFNHNTLKEKESTKEFKLEKLFLGKKIKKKQIRIDEKIDFHGMSLLEAETYFKEAIKNCYKKNLRCILFVTGKGVFKKEQNSNDTPKLYYGKIRNNFVLWANNIDLSKYILSVEQATNEYGADGAFFVYLRKQKY